VTTVVSVQTIHPESGAVPLGRFGPHEIDSLRLLLRGNSVVDWYRLHFDGKDEVRAFLRVNELDPDAPSDGARLADLMARARQYLVEHLRYRIPEPVAEADVIGLFELAAGRGRRAHRLYACLVLKVMHIINHVEAHELLSMLPISHAEVGVMLHAKVERVVRGLLERRFPIVDFAGSTKTFHSTVSKLLAKRETQAAQVFDRLRFRIVVERLEDIPPLLVALTRELIPFNYIIPNQSENTLVNPDEMLVRSGNLAAIRADRTESALNELDPVERRGMVPATSSPAAGFSNGELRGSGSGARGPRCTRAEPSADGARTHRLWHRRASGRRWGHGGAQRERPEPPHALQATAARPRARAARARKAQEDLPPIARRHIRLSQFQFLGSSGSRGRPPPEITRSSCSMLRFFRFSRPRFSQPVHRAGRQSPRHRTNAASMPPTWLLIEVPD
jgi:uncharacterized protein (TIGR04552 family)